MEVESRTKRPGHFRSVPFEDVYTALGGDISDCDLDLISGENSIGWYIRKVHGVRYATYRKLKNNKIERCLHLHRLIAERIIGRPLKRSEIVDHVDGNGMNNYRSNLRACTNAENLRNRRNPPSDNKSGIMGVAFCKQTRKWAAEIRVDGKKIWLGRFSDKEKAISVRRDAEKQYWGEFAPNWGTK